MRLYQGEATFAHSQPRMSPSASSTVVATPLRSNSFAAERGRLIHFCPPQVLYGHGYAVEYLTLS